MDEQDREDYAELDWPVRPRPGRRLDDPVRMRDVLAVVVAIVALCLIAVTLLAKLVG